MNHVTRPYPEERPVALLTAYHLLEAWDGSPGHLDALREEFVRLHPRFRGLFIDATRRHREKQRQRRHRR